MFSTWLLCGDITRPHPESMNQSVDLLLPDRAVVESSLAALAVVLVSFPESSSLSSDLSPSVTMEVFPAFVLFEAV